MKQNIKTVKIGKPVETELEKGNWWQMSDRNEIPVVYWNMHSGRVKLVKGDKEIISEEKGPASRSYVIASELKSRL